MLRISATSQYLGPRFNPPSQPSFEDEVCLRIAFQPVLEKLSSVPYEIACRLSEQWTEREIASHMGISRGTVTRCKEKLRQAWQRAPEF